MSSDSSRQNRAREHSLFGGLGLSLGVLVVVLLVFAILRVVIAWRGESPAAALRDAITQSAIFGACLVVLFAIFALWQSGTVRRNRSLRAERLDAVVLSSGRSPRTVDALRSLAGADSSELSVPLGLSLVADPVGLEVWGGWAQARLIASFPWVKVQSVEVTNVAELGRRSRGLLFNVIGQGGVVELPFIITGRGFAGLYPERERVLEDVAHEMRELSEA